MNKICEYLIYKNDFNIINEKTSITYYVRLSPEDLISCDTTDNNDIVNYISEILHKYFHTYNYEIILNYDIPIITFKYYTYSFKIKFNKRHDGTLYWILLL